MSSESAPEANFEAMLFLFAHWKEISALQEERTKLARRVQATEPIYDPIEDDPRYRDILKAAESEAELELASIERGMGFCHRFWKTKKTILIKKYGVVWFSPSDLNPKVQFD